MTENAILLLALIGLVAFLAQWAAWRVKLPGILFLLAAGLLLGPGTGILRPDELFGDLLFPLISLSVAVILFEGSLTLSLEEIRAQQGVVKRLVTIGALITWVVVAAVAHWLFELSGAVSILFGALMVVTGPTVIAPILRTVRPNSTISGILRWEGIVIDPIGALLVVVVFQFVIATSHSAGLLNGLLTFVKVLLIGGGVGIAVGATLGWLLRVHWIPEYLQSLATLALVFCAYSFSDHFAHESGLLAVTVMGIWLANRKELHLSDILNFKEDLSVVLISGLFIILAARLDVEQLQELGWTPLLLLIAIQFIARPLSVLASTWNATLSWQEKALLSWVAPRGIVAAAVSALFAIRLEQAGEPGAATLVPLTFVVIIGTVVIQSATARALAKWLGVAEPAPRGFLIVGANPVARAIGSALHKHGFRVLLTDSNWEAIRTARMDGLETFYGNPVSEYADQRLDLVGIGKLLALSPRTHLNVVASMRYSSEFGRRNLYTLRTTEEARSSEKHHVTDRHRGYTLFDEELTYARFNRLLIKGAEIRSTKLSEEYDFRQLIAAQEVIPLFAITPKDEIRVFVSGGEMVPEAGWTVLSLETQIEDASDPAQSP